MRFLSFIQEAYLGALSPLAGNVASLPVIGATPPGLGYPQPVATQNQQSLTSDRIALGPDYASARSESAGRQPLLSDRHDAAYYNAVKESNQKKQKMNDGFKVMMICSVCLPLVGLLLVPALLDLKGVGSKEQLRQALSRDIPSGETLQKSLADEHSVFATSAVASALEKAAPAELARYRTAYSAGPKTQASPAAERDKTAARLMASKAVEHYLSGVERPNQDLAQYVAAHTQYLQAAQKDPKFSESLASLSGDTSVPVAHKREHVHYTNWLDSLIHDGLFRHAAPVR